MVDPPDSAAYKQRSMKITFLGTSSATPTRRRNVSALAFQPEQRSEWWLFDCGEGTQHQVLRSSFTLPKLRNIFITHLHGDHCFGLMGLLASRALQGAPEPLDLYGPRGIEDLINAVRKTCGLYLPYALTIHQIPGPGIVYEDDEYVVRGVEVVHAGQTISYIIDEKPQAGRFRIEEAQRLNIPPGPLYGKLKKGEKVRLDDGREIDGATLVDPPRVGRKVVLMSDSCDSSAAVPLAQDADFVVHEATYLGSTDAAQAKEHRHSTAADAGRFAAAIHARKLAITHISARYEQPDPEAKSVKDLVAEAKSVFSGEVCAAEDFLTVDVPRREGKN
jgi:ribonuclease Z